MGTAVDSLDLAAVFSGFDRTYDRHFFFVARTFDHLSVCMRVWNLYT